jgi:hypothetical protein
MNASVELPARHASGIVLVDGEQIEATRSGDYWVLPGEISGTVLLEVK